MYKSKYLEKCKGSEDDNGLVEKEVPAPIKPSHEYMTKQQLGLMGLQQARNQQAQVLGNMSGINNSLIGCANQQQRYIRPWTHLVV